MYFKKRHAGYYRKKRVQKWARNIARRLEIRVLQHLGLISNLTLPDFLIIGAPKAGTWWLAKNLSAHPQVYLATGETRGELHYFDAGFHRSIRQYSSYFEPAGDRLAGEKTPCYCILSRKRIQLIRMLLPDVRLLLMLRDPVERLWSEAMMMLVRKRKISYEELEEGVLWEWLTRNRDRVLYSQVFKEWESAYPPGQLHVGFLEEVKQSPKELLRRVFEHLGVKTDIDWGSLPYSQVVNEGPGVRIPRSYAKTMREWYGQELEWLRCRFGGKVAGWL